VHLLSRWRADVGDLGGARLGLVNYARDGTLGAGFALVNVYGRRGRVASSGEIRAKLDPNAQNIATRLGHEVIHQVEHMVLKGPRQWAADTEQ
jgi:hypothetical protein